MKRRRQQWTRTLISVGVVALVAAACVPVEPALPPPPPPPLPAPPPTVAAPSGFPSFADATILGELESPIWDLAFTTDDHALMTLRGRGSIAVWRDNDVAGFPTGPRELVVQPAGVSALPDAWTDGPESGALGLALHPDFDTNHNVYVCYTTNAAKVRVLRYTTDAAPYTTLSNETVIVDGIDTGAPPTGFHHGCRVKFQPLTSPPALWVTVGDGGIGTAPQSLATGGGKVLRMTEIGTPYPGNPFAGQLPQSLVFSRGHRNPQGLAFRGPGEAEVYTSEHGPSIDDEVNHLVKGGNAGWAPHSPYDQSVSMTDLGRFPDAVVPAWRSAEPTLAVSGMTFLTNPIWGDWVGSLVVATLKSRQLLVLHPDGAGGFDYAVAITTIGDPVDPSGAPPLNRHPRLRTVVEHPVTGALYVPTDHPSLNPLSPTFNDARPGALVRVTPGPPTS